MDRIGARLPSIRLSSAPNSIGRSGATAGPVSSSSMSSAPRLAQMRAGLRPESLPLSKAPPLRSSSLRGTRLGPSTKRIRRRALLSGQAPEGVWPQRLWAWSSPGTIVFPTAQPSMTHSTLPSRLLRSTPTSGSEPGQPPTALGFEIFLFMSRSAVTGTMWRQS
jgi:hypothetical protein